MTSISKDSLPDVVIIWGASGFIGRNLVEYLRTRVPRVVAVSRSGAILEGAECCTPEECEGVGFKGDVVAINLAAERYDASRFQHYQSRIFTANVELATRFYLFCLERGIREARVASSIAVYPEGETLLDDGVPVNRDILPSRSEAMYGSSKRIAEEIAALYHAQYGIHSILLRLSNPYGPFDSMQMERAHVLAAFVMRALMTKGSFAVRGGKEATRDFIYVRDVCDIIYRSLAVRGRQAAYNVATGLNTKITDLAALVLRYIDPARPVVFEGEPTSSVVHRVCKVDRLKKDFGLQSFTPLEAGLKETIAWYQAQLH